MALVSEAEFKIRLENVQQKIEHYKEVDQVTLVAVTKRFALEAYDYCLNNNIFNVGENRVQELQTKFESLNQDKLNKLILHFIGGLQKNKVKYLQDQVQSIDSISSQSLLETIQKRFSQPVEVLLQINSTSEKEKSGIALDDKSQLEKLVETCIESDKIKLSGLMTMGPTPDKSYCLGQSQYDLDLSHAFDNTRVLYEKLQEQYQIKFYRLSMGMSNDFHLALKHGANEIRIGSSLFGNRE